MSGLPQKPTPVRTREVLEVLAVGAAAVAVGAYFTMRLTENRRKIAMDAIQDEGLRIEKPAVSTESNLAEPPKSPESEEGSVLEDEMDPESSAGGGGAYNPVTGEINWDCPCLGGMAHGPCGPEFREAFSCFVYSEDEPKGINCVDKFKNMQDCFRRHPEEYAEEIADDDEPLESEEGPDAGEEATGVAATTKETPQGEESASSG